MQCVADILVAHTIASSAALGTARAAAGNGALLARGGVVVGSAHAADSVSK